MAARSKARKRALDILFEAEARRESPSALLESRTVLADPPVSSYAAELVRGVQAHRDQIDELLTEYSRGWSLDRMPAVDRNVLRIGAYELLWGIGVPAAVAINEAVLLAQSLSTDGSPAFVNGLLARLLAERPSIVGDALSEQPDVGDPAAVDGDADGDGDGDGDGLADDDADADEPA
jgi:transcription antitermination protein NusB